jgi:hypothetical protein
MSKRLSLFHLVSVALAVCLLAAPSLAQRPDERSVRAPRLAVDGQLAAINDMVPGFGGMYEDEGGVLNVYLLPSVGEQQRRLFGPDVRFRDADFEFRQLLGWRDSLRNVLGRAGVALLDADESRNRVRIGIERGAPANVERAIRARLRALGVPQEAVVFQEVPPILPMQTLRDPFDPVPGGVEIHWSNFLCTLGFNVRRAVDTAPTQSCFFVTNDHCTDVQGQVTGTVYMQPLFGPQIAEEVLDPPFFSGGVCPAGRICRYSDASMARYYDAADCQFGAIARTDALNSITIDPNAPRWKIVRKLAGASVGHLVAKVGRTTGWTEGTVSQTCVDVNVSGSNITRLCQSLVPDPNPGDPFPIVGSGDSGSPVFLRRLDSSQAALVGILWGGDAAGTIFVFSPVENIEREFGFKLKVY